MAREGSIRKAAAGSGAWRPYLLVALLGAALMFIRLDATSLDEHECHVALTARTMTEADAWLLAEALPDEPPPATALNRWLVPVENGRPRLVKTPLAYWLASLAALASTGVNEWTVRGVSAVAAVLTAMIVLALGRRMVGERAALLGALMLLTSVGFFRWGRDARPEMLLCLTMTAAMACFYFGLEAPSRRAHVAWMAAGWVAMGLGHLTKQFVPLLLLWPLAAFICWREFARRAGDGPARRLLGRLLIVSAAAMAVHAVAALCGLGRLRLPVGNGLSAGTVTLAAAAATPIVWVLLRARAFRAVGRLLPTAAAGMIVSTAMIVPWMLAMAALFPQFGRVLSEQVVERTTSSGWGPRGPAYYFLRLPGMLLPWPAFFAIGLAAPLARVFARRRKPLAYLLLWSAGVVLLFTGSAGKRAHYILPALPPLALLMGVVADDAFFRGRWIRPALARWIGGAYGPVGIVAAGGLAGVWFVTDRDPRYGTMGLVVALAAGPMFLAGLRAWRGRFRTVAALLIASFALVLLGQSVWGHLWDTHSPSKRFGLAAGAMVPPGDDVCSWRGPHWGIVYYFGRNAPDACRAPPAPTEQLDPKQVHQFVLGRLAGRGGAPWIISYLCYARELAALGYQPVLTEPTGRSTYNYFVVFRLGRATPRTQDGSRGPPGLRAPPGPG